ncbi:Uncharacterised protein [Bordetella pertussis]|nr:Uncharacterised protein [Bordetella pertussis]CFP16356.1 Uncharacterised protein [Bordetella pertussis]CFP70801.1 Uncharacterised protein [Bordetella pertussis]CFU12769.1 Uncharacterised protein [Bordetella pertussis]CPO28542.1 Uncharacterised protein [Bordetella pertussis]
MRPRGSTAVASTITRPAPDRASCIRCCICHSLAWPSRAEYWHMGDTTIRLGSSRAPICKAENNADMLSSGRNQR